jgi:putative endonuclease
VAFANFFNLFRKRTSMGRLRSDSDVGREGEVAAAEFLRKAGLSIMEQNWSCPVGEVDLIGRRDGLWVFVEVKTSRKLSAWPPEIRVNSRKQQKLRSLAKYYLKQHRLDSPCRFDVVSVWWDDAEIKIRHIENAF